MQRIGQAMFRTRTSESGLGDARLRRWVSRRAQSILRAATKRPALQVERTILRVLSMLLCVFELAAAWILFLPTAITAAEPGTIEIYESEGAYILADPPPHMHPIILQVPENFRYGSSKGASRNWGINILTYYPNFTSPEDPENAKFGLSCAGDCNGRILILVENMSRGLARSNSPSRGDYVARATTKWYLTPPYPSNVRVSSLGPNFGFDEGYERVTTVPDPVTGRMSSNIARVERYYFRKAADKAHIDLAATCNVNSQRTTCILHFSLRCNAGIAVSVNGLDSQYLPSSGDIKDKADHFISEMVRVPACEPRGAIDVINKLASSTARRMG
jgi:hypothetical protein